MQVRVLLGVQIVIIMNLTESLKQRKDYTLYYCKRLKRHYLTLGYFGGGPLNIEDTHKMAMQFMNLLDVPYESIFIDEILHSRRFKHFKLMYSDEIQEPHPESTLSDDVIKWFHD